VEKVYLARVQGHPAADEFICDAPIAAEPGKLGTREVSEGGQAAHTTFKVLRRDADDTALVEARPRTGRTNQIRLHLRHLGHPITGEPAYLADGGIGDAQTLALTDPLLCLHAWRITFVHPLTRERVTHEAAAPAWAV